jgi:hypothetical protein
MTLNKKLTKSEFRQRADKILMRLSLEVMPFWADSEEKHKQRLSGPTAKKSTSSGWSGPPVIPYISAAPICRTIFPTARRLFTMS